MKNNENANKMERNNRKNPIMIAVMACALILVGILGSYAYFMVTTGTKEEEKVTVQTGNMALAFNDGTDSFQGSLDFGETALKTFNIVNSGSLDAVARINWKDLKNTYGEGSLTYTLSYSETEGGTYTDIVTNKKVPRSTTEITKVLANGLTIPAGKTYYFKLVITLNYLADKDQTEDINAMLSTRFTLEEGTIDPTGIATEVLLSKKNGETVTDYSSGNKGEMFTFNHNELTTTSSAYEVTYTHSATQVMDWTEEERTDYRYIGNTPNNYIDFNDETWRIIGVFTVENASGTKEQRIKIIRDELISNMEWDTNNKNEWSNSTLSALLNSGNYYNRTEAHSTNGLTTTAKSQISPVKWYLGGTNTMENIDASDYYNFERGDKTCVQLSSGEFGCEGETRSINTIANVGLMYPSDFVYTYANGVDNTCYTNGYYCNSGIPSNGWLFNDSGRHWTITPNAVRADFVYILDDNGSVSGNYVSMDGTYETARPSVYLNSDIEIIGGNGTAGNPYQLKES